MTEEIDYETVRGEAKWNGETVGAREERILDWCTDQRRANIMYEELQRKLAHYRHEREQAEESCRDEVRTINALKVKIHEEGWQYENR